MKKQLRACFISLLFFGFALSAYPQITVTRNDFADINDFTAGASDTILTGISPGGAGAAQTWDFDSMNAHVMDTSYFMAPASTPYASSFPSANLVAYNSLDSSYYYVDANTNVIDIVGNVIPNPFTGSPLILSFTPPVTQITFPSTMASAFNVNNATAQSTFYYNDTYLTYTFDSIRVTSIINRQSVIDGWGTAITPAGSFNSLRQKLTEISTFNIEAYVVIPPLGWTPLPFGGTDTSIHYYYLANGQNWAVAEIETDYSGNVTGGQYLVNAANSVPELTFSGNNDLVIYPNPSSGEFNISVLNPKAAVLKVFDVQGRETEKIAIDNSMMRFSVSSYSNGIFLFQLLDKTGVIISTGRLTVQK